MATPTLDANTLAGQYGFAAGFFGSDPELQNLLNQAVKDQWTPDRFKASFMATNWYRNKSDTVRQVGELQSRDPATWNQRLGEEAMRISHIAQQMGIQYQGNEYFDFARQSLMYGWDTDNLKGALAGQWRNEQSTKAGNYSGQAAEAATDMRRIAGDYGVTMSDYDLERYTFDVLTGAYNQDSYTNYIRDLARGKYPGMRAYIDQGMSVRQVASPYLQSYSNLLEKDPNTVSLDEALIQKALQGVPDPKTGMPTMQSLYQFEQSVRQDKRWLQTQNAHDQVENTAMQIARDFGLHS